MNSEPQCGKGLQSPPCSLPRAYPAPEPYRSLSLSQRPRQEGRRATFLAQVVLGHPRPEPSRSRFLGHVANPHRKEVQQDSTTLIGRRLLARLDHPVDKSAPMIEAD
jgi:hypothetical protein